LKIAFVTPELQSLVRRTNLAEVAESLPRTLAALGHEVRVYLPRTIDVTTEPLTFQGEVGSVLVPDVRGRTRVGVREARLGEVRLHLLEHPKLFEGRHPYGDENGPYPDNWRRYAIFARAVLESLELTDLRPDIIHCFDWTTGLIPLFRELEYVEKRPDHHASGGGVYFAIHNLAMQGAFEREILPKIGVPLKYFRHVRGVSLDGRVNFLKTGAEFATIIGTHSPTQAQRIQQLDRGYGLEETFTRRKKELVGVSNGIDYAAWDPAKDSFIPATFSANGKGELPGKRRCKAHIQAAFHLDKGPRTPVVGVIGRFDSDSGFDLLAEVMTGLLERNFEVVMMGQGQREIVERIRTIESTFTGRCRLSDGYHVQTAHQLIAGADVLMFPSHYQPTNALCAIGMRYGAVPLVYEHAGLDDVVLDLEADPRKGTGFTFKSYSGDGLLEAMEQVRVTYRKASDWKKLVARCMAQDFSWEATGAEYLKAYRRVTRRVRGKQKEELS